MYIKRMTTMVAIFFLSSLMMGMDYAGASCPYIKFTFCEKKNMPIKPALKVRTYYYVGAPECIAIFDREEAWSQRVDRENTCYMVYSYGGDRVWGGWDLNQYAHAYFYNGEGYYLGPLSPSLGRMPYGGGVGTPPQCTLTCPSKTSSVSDAGPS